MEVNQFFPRLSITVAFRCHRDKLSVSGRRFRQHRTPNAGWETGDVRSRFLGDAFSNLGLNSKVKKTSAEMPCA